MVEMKIDKVNGVKSFSRLDFPLPPYFVFGSSTSAYQVEGAAFEDGRTPSIWDTHAHSGYTNGANGDISCDGYHKYKEDVHLMVETGLEAYRFSISWSRLIPNGTGAVNPKALQFYNNLINELINHGNSSTEPYIVAHNIILAHAATARLYLKKYKAAQHGFIGIDLYAYWYVPYTNAVEDAIATERAYDFFIGWFLNPLVYGDYPAVMKMNAGTRIPTFTKLESRLVKGSFDFLGMNHYSTIQVEDMSISLQMDVRDFTADMAVNLILNDSNVPQGQLPLNPTGLTELLEHLKNYGNPPIYIYENGQSTIRNGTLQDIPRVKYIQSYIGSLLDAIRNGSNTRGYFIWSFLDVFELLDGYESGYGLYYVDLDDKNLKRYPKLSAQWYANFLKGSSTSPDQEWK